MAQFRVIFKQAVWAGGCGANKNQTTLVVSEGQSASSLYKAECEQDPKRYGFITTMGKPTNKFFNLLRPMLIDADTGKKRYGRIICCTDADTDGFVIKDYFFCDLLEFAPSYHTEECLWKLFLPLFYITTKNGGDTKFLFSKFEYDTWVKDHFDDIRERTHCKGANNITAIVANQLKTTKYLKQFSGRNAGNYKLNACAEKIAQINSLS